MAATPPSNSKSSGDEGKSENYVPLTFEDKLNQAWQKNRMLILGACAAVLVFILGKGLWERMERSKELDIEAAYGAASTPDQLRAFAVAHPDHSLAGLAELRIADEAYTAGKSTDAVAEYEKAIAALKTGPLVARAQLGRALAKVQAGKVADGTAELKQIAGDASLLKAVRAEAAYQLASLAADEKNSADVQKYVEQLNQIDPASVWARRAMTLPASLPKQGAPAGATPSAASSSQTGSSVQIKLPGK